MLLLEILAGRNKAIVKKTDEFWVLYNSPKMHFFPRYSNSWEADLMKFYGAENYKEMTWKEQQPIRNKFKKLITVDYGDKNSHGWFLVTKGTVNFDISRFSSMQNRRRNTPMNQEHKDRNGEVPILMGELSFSRVLEMRKCLQLLMKLKPETASYKLLGDDRVRGMTVQDVVQGAAEKHDQTRVFQAGKLKELVMYHGTSEKRAAVVLKTGLRPSKRGSTYYDLIPGYSEHNVYLASSPAEAANYATREAVNDKSNAAILEITLNPMQILKLLPDEDNMNWLKSVPKEYKAKLLREYPILDEIWHEKGFDVHMRNLDHQNQKFGLKWLFDTDEPYWRKDEKPDPFKPNAQKILKKHGYTQKNIESLEKALYVALMNTFIESTRTMSLKKTGLAAYPGAIPAKQIRLLKTWSIKDSVMRADADRDTYVKASEKQEKTVKYHEKDES